MTSKRTLQQPKVSGVHQHFVTFYSPGTFVSETNEKPIDSWDTNKACDMAKSVTQRYNATPYGFRFSTRSRGEGDLDSKETHISPMYYLGGTVETLAQVKRRATEKDRILIANMEGNKWGRIITNTNSYRFTANLQEDDVVLEWPR